VSYQQGHDRDRLVGLDGISGAGTPGWPVRPVRSGHFIRPVPASIDLVGHCARSPGEGRGSNDGRHYRHITGLDVDGRPGEVTLRFLGHGRMVALPRSEVGDKHADVGVSDTPHTRWTWRELPRSVKFAFVALEVVHRCSR